MPFETIPNHALKIHNCKMKCDERIAEGIPAPLPSHSFCMCICGVPGSGKTVFINSLVGAKKRKGIPQGYKRVFHHVIICSPSRSSLVNDIYKDLDENKKHDQFDDDFLDFLTEFTDESSEEEETTLCILDDVASQLKRSQSIQRRLAYLIQNRRHRYLSFMISVQYYKNLPLPIRSALTHLVLFRPANKKELDHVSDELLPIPKSQVNDLISFIYDAKHNFMYVDMSLRDSSKYEFYKNFDLILL
jgi:hypothetical protein